MHISNIHNIYSNPLFEKSTQQIIENNFDINLIKFIETIDNKSPNPLDNDIKMFLQKLESDKLFIKPENITFEQFNTYLEKYINLIKYYYILTIKQEKKIKECLNETKNHIFFNNMKYQYFKNIMIFKKLTDNVKRILPINIPNCEICFTNTKNIVFVPCGHSLCKSCLENYIKIYNYKKCHVCRTEITNFYDIFY